MGLAVRTLWLSDVLCGQLLFQKIAGMVKPNIFFGLIVAHMCIERHFG